jgi:hypothetical protein
MKQGIYYIIGLVVRIDTSANSLMIPDNRTRIKE